MFRELGALIFPITYFIAVIAYDSLGAIGVPMSPLMTIKTGEGLQIGINLFLCPLPYRAGLFMNGLGWLGGPRQTTRARPGRGWGLRVLMVNTSTIFNFNPKSPPTILPG